MNSQIIVSIVTIALAAAVIGVGVYGYLNELNLFDFNTMADETLDLSVNGVTSYSGSLMHIADMKPSITRYSDTIDLAVSPIHGRVFKKISDVNCNQGTQTEPEIVEENGVARYDVNIVTWFDLNVNGQQTILDGWVTVKDVENKWIYLGCFNPDVTVPVVQSFHLQSDVINWAQGDECEFVETFAVQTIDQPYPGECFNDCNFCLDPASVSVYDYDQGLTNTGGAVLPERSDPTQALEYETGMDPHNFFSLGFGGWIILEYNYPIPNKPGTDVKVIEDTWTTPYPLESAAVYASQDANDWTYLGTADNVQRDPVYGYHTIDSFDLGSLAWAKYIKVVDTTKLADFAGYTGADGYDLNAVIALTECVEMTC